MTKQETTRRNFLKGAGIAVGATIGGAMLAGCANQQTDDQTGALSTTGGEYDEEYDVIVVGGGLAGLSAAVTVGAEGNGATCLLLEKSPNHIGGGNSPFSGGMIFWSEDYDAMLDYMKALRGGNETVSDSILEAYCRESVKNIEWLQSLGAPDDLVFRTVETTDLSTGIPYPAEYYEFDPTHCVVNVNFNTKNPDGIDHPIKFLDIKADEMADVITRKFESPATDLIQDPSSKAIVGVVYDDGKQTHRAKANKGVIMCCGGFENNPEMMWNHFKTLNAHPAAGVHNTGDGIAMCSKVGAKMWHMAGIAGFWPHVVSLDGTQFTSNLEMIDPGHGGILVGGNGRRFMADVRILHYGNLTDVEEDALYTTGNRHGDIQLGGEWKTGHLPATMWGVWDTDGFNNLGVRYWPHENPVEEGWALRADSIEELAQLMEIDPTELKKTVDHWNTMMEEGEDTQFYRNDYDYMMPIATPPFYAARQVPWFLNTDGGAERNEFGQILDYDKNPIPGLYGAGEFGSIWSDMYQGGGNVAECLIFGRISTRHCLGIEG